MAKRKCLICGNLIEDNNDSIPYKNRYVHKLCFESTVKLATTEKKNELKEKSNARKKRVTKPKAETIKDALSEEDYKQKTELFDYIRQLTEQTELSTKVYVLVGSYIEKYQYTYLGIKQALEYFYDIKNNPVSGDCIGIVPYMYSEAKDYYNQIETIKKDVESKHLKNMYKTKTVRINPHKAKKVQLLDIENIGK